MSNQLWAALLSEILSKQTLSVSNQVESDKSDIDIDFNSVVSGMEQNNLSNLNKRKQKISDKILSGKNYSMNKMDRLFNKQDKIGQKIANGGSGISKLTGKSMSLGSSKGGSIASAALGAFNSIAGVGDVEKTGKTAEVAGAASDLIEGVSGSINPLGSSVASAGKTVGYLIGGKKDRVEGTGSAIVGGVAQGLSYLGPWGMAAGAALNLINGIGGKRVDSFTDLSGEFTSDYSGSAFDVNETHTKYSNKKAGLFDFGFAKKGNNAVREAVWAQNKILDTQDYNKKRLNNNIGQDLQSAILSKYQGNQQIMLSKKGSKFPELDTVRAILESSKVKSFKSGGKIEKENIIPTGALHKNLHHIDDIGIDITQKGIPVVTMDEGGEFKEQVAEVEAAELTLSLNVTKQIEEYWQNYKESGDDNIAIECGKYLVDQIFNNTIDDDKVIKKTE